MSKDFWEDDAQPIADQKSGFWEDDAQPIKQPRTPQGESVMRGAAQGLLFGLPDEATSAVEATGDTLFGDAKLRDYVDTYRQKQKVNQGIYDKAQQDNPKSYMTGEIGGSLASSFVPGLGWMNAGKKATTAVKVGKAALQGGLSGLGASKSSGLDGYEGLKDVASDTATGAGMGLAGAGAGELVGKFGRSVKNGLSDFSDWNTLKAAGAMTGDRKALRYQGKTKEIADFLRKKGIVSFGSTVDDSLERARGIKEPAGQQISDSLSKLDEYVAKSDASKPFDRLTDQIDEEPMMGFSPSKTKARIESDVIAPKRTGMSENRRVGERLQEDADLLGEHGDRMSFVDANKKKNEIYDTVKNYGKEQSPYIEGLKEYGGAFNKSMEDAADDVAMRSGDEALSADWKMAKKDYGSASTVEKMAANRSDQIKTNNALGLTDYVIGAGALGSGLTSDDPSKALYAAPLMLANRVARSRGASMAGISSQKLLQALSGPSGQKYQRMFEGALQKGPQAVALTHRLLVEKDPEYRKLLEERNQ